VSKLGARKVSIDIHQQTTKQLARPSTISRVLTQQNLSLKLESISKFTDQIKSVLEEAKFAIYKFQENMTKYYNQRYTPALVFHSGDNVFLNSLDIYITCYSYKLSHYCLKPYIIEKQVRLILYYLKLLSTLHRLYLIFLVVKLITAPTNSISGKYSSSSLDLVIIYKEEEWEIEKILDSH